MVFCLLAAANEAVITSSSSTATPPSSRPRGFDPQAAGSSTLVVPIFLDHSLSPQEEVALPNTESPAHPLILKHIHLQSKHISENTINKVIFHLLISICIGMVFAGDRFVELMIVSMFDV